MLIYWYALIDEYIKGHSDMSTFKRLEPAFQFHVDTWRSSRAC